MSRDVQVSAEAAYDLGLHVVWCPEYRCPALEGPVAARLRELVREKVAATGWPVVACGVMPDHVYIDTRYERPWRKEKTR